MMRFMDCFIIQRCFFSEFMKLFVNLSMGDLFAQNNLKILQNLSRTFSDLKNWNSSNNIPRLALVSKYFVQI